METSHMTLVSVQPGEEVLESIGRQAADLGITDGAIVSLIGAVDACRISNMRTGDHRDNIAAELHQPLELSGSGEIKNGTVHIHCTVSAPNIFAHHGHLRWARVDHNFVNAYIIPL